MNRCATAVKVAIRLSAAAFNVVELDSNREINPVVMSVTKYFSQLASHDRFVKRLDHESKIFVLGDEDKFEKLA